MVKNKIIVLIFSLVIFSSCGFKVVKLSELNNFYINEIDTEGDKRVSYEIRNTLVSMTKNPEKKLINLKLNSNKTRTIKEKNIKNEITKYEINIAVEITTYDRRYDIIHQFTETSKGSYSVSNQHSQTLSNEKKQTKILSKRISERIYNKLRDISNDF